MKRILKIIIVFLIVLFALTGCENSAYEQNMEIINLPSNSSRFICIDSFTIKYHPNSDYIDNAIIYYDKETKVEYIYTYKSGFTVLLDADGKPILYKEE